MGEADVGDPGEGARKYTLKTSRNLKEELGQPTQVNYGVRGIVAEDAGFLRIFPSPHTIMESESAPYRRRRSITSPHCGGKKNIGGGAKSPDLRDKVTVFLTYFLTYLHDCTSRDHCAAESNDRYELLMMLQITARLTGIEMMTEMKTLAVIIRAATEADQRRFSGHIIRR